MGRTKAEKLFDYVSQGEVCKVKTFLKKHRRDHRLDVNAKLAGRGQRQRTLVHVVCAAGDDAMLRVLMRHGARLDEQDSHGDTPLHLALERVQHGHKHAFHDLVLPILEKMRSSPGILDIANKRGLTSRQLLQDVEQASLEKVEQMKREFEEGRAESERRKEEAEWQARLQDEWADEMAGMSDRRTWDDRSYGGQSHESFDDWATRMTTERKDKQRRHEQSRRTSSRSRDGATSKQSEEEKRKFQRKLEEEHEKYQQRRSERLRRKLAQQKAEYLRRCGEVFDDDDKEGPALDVLGFDDVPWPSGRGKDAEEMLAVLLCDVDRGDAAGFRRFVRSQQLLWHPDKFQQRCGGRLAEGDRARILARVTLLSQALNQLGEEAKTS